MVTLMTNTKSGIVHVKRPDANMSLCGAVNYECHKTRRTKTSRHEGDLSEVNCRACEREMKQNGLDGRSGLNKHLRRMKYVCSWIEYRETAEQVVSETTPHLLNAYFGDLDPSKACAMLGWSEQRLSDAFSGDSPLSFEEYANMSDVITRMVEENKEAIRNLQ